MLNKLVHNVGGFRLSISAGYTAPEDTSLQIGAHAMVPAGMASIGVLIHGPDIKKFATAVAALAAEYEKVVGK